MAEAQQNNHFSIQQDRKLHLAERVSENNETKKELYRILNELAALVREKRGTAENPKDALYQQLIDRLSTSPFIEKFQHVFQTDQGSWYFVLPTNEAFRFKRMNVQDQQYYEPQFFTPQIFFLSEEEVGLMKSYFEQQNYDAAQDLKGFQFAPQPLREGVLPVEFGEEKISKDGVDVTSFQFQESDGKRTVHGAETLSFEYDDPNEKRKPETSPKFHIGHKISKIVK